MQETLNSLITQKGFEQYSTALATRCETEGIDYSYQYSTPGDTLTVWMNFGNIPVTIEITTEGLATFNYFKGGLKKTEKFRNFTAEDTHMLIDHAFLYLRDRNFDHHKEWHSNLEMF
ncbi:hypothetical protein ACLI1A_18460 [Flavobacterium sp. RHBU_3]|uniref:hypothetical protein n=1 Tax=Flavobacterium sp. RHBU_3 TaxID=3391184 RepID=UPI0039851646